MIEYTEKDFNIKRLGSLYTKEVTTFKVFAPEHKAVFLVIHDHKYEMHKKDYTFEIALKGDLELIPYHYENDNGETFRDPFAYYCDKNESYVLDPDKFIKKVVLPKRNEDVFIYETSVRDFSSDETYPGIYKKKFLSFTEDNLKLHEYYVVGLDYLKNIGFTHIQLMPTFEFDNDNSEYNWGYNPVEYNCVEKDYVVDQVNPYAYINELRQTVNTLHSNDMRVTLDVVFNHVYNREAFDLNKMIPGHVFRMKEDGTYAEGTFCGNEIKSEDPFVRAYILEMLERYVMLYDVDGFRFDLMGIIDYQTINMAKARLQAIKSSFFIYGEGWNMGDSLDESLRATLINANKMPGIAFFNDYFRDTIINYVSGNNDIREKVKEVLTGNNNGLSYKQSINYVECHDNLTFFDRMITYLGKDTLETNIRRSKLALSLCILARGIPFIHSGQEFLRTKALIDNSYRSSDNINNLDWDRRVEYNSVCDYAKDLMAFRRARSEFISPNVEVSFEDYYDCIVYKLNNIRVIINPTNYDYEYKDNNNHHVVFDFNGNTDYQTDLIKIPAHCLAIAEL